MKRIPPEIFLAVNGILLSLFLWIVFRFLRQRDEEHLFRDNLWTEKQKQVFKELDIIAAQKEKTEPAPIQEEKFHVPNFAGAAHEILGITANATREQISEAYRHWVTRYHPDRVNHLGAAYIEQAKLRTEQLNQAKELLVKQLKS